MRKLITPQRRAPRSGFTLIELLIVLAIIVAIAAMVAPNLISRQQEAKDSITLGTIRNIDNAIQQKAVANEGTFPKSDDAIRELAQKSETSRGREVAPYLNEVPRDGWGNEFHYEYDAKRDITKPRVWSSGADGKDDGGSGDDVANWSDEDDK
jgi:general secretion pathway protein G